MKVVLLAGGIGTRLSEETSLKPKPMVEIGGKPILWHIMKIYSHYGFNDFVVCLGYKGHYIKEWFSHFYLHHSDVTFDLEKNDIQFHRNAGEKWRVTLIDTGIDTMTGGRIKKAMEFIGQETIMATYGDGVGDINIRELLEFHKKHKKLATLTSIKPEGRFGALGINRRSRVASFSEKKDNDTRINAGFFVLEPEIYRYIKDDDTTFEQAPLERLAKERKLYAYPHNGFWRPMDSLRDKTHLENLWSSGEAPWKIWN